MERLKSLKSALFVDGGLFFSVIALTATFFILSLIVS